MLSLGVRGGYRLRRQQRRQLSRVGIHVLAGLRLRNRLAARQSGGRHGVAPPHDDALGDAIVAPNGGVLHARGEASLPASRAALSSAARRIEEARGPARGDAEHALELWRGLVAGTWSLVDTFERDGSRYMLARQNHPNLNGPKSLTTRERAVAAYVARGQTTKEIAYSLGVADTTVLVLLMRAMRECAVKDRRALVELLTTGRFEGSGTPL